VVHFGAGTGYFSAIMAHIVGPSGRVTAIEYNTEIAERARHYLESTSNVRVVHGDGFTCGIDPADVIYVSAGVSHISNKWLDALRDGGRVIVPMSTRAAFRSLKPGPIDFTKLAPLLRSSAVFRIVRVGGRFHVKNIHPAAFIP